MEIQKSVYDLDRYRRIKRRRETPYKINVAAAPKPNVRGRLSDAVAAAISWTIIFSLAIVLGLYLSFTGFHE